MRRRIRSSSFRRRGASALQFALAFPVMAAGIFGVLDFGRLFWLRNTLQFAAEETGRYASMTTGATSTQLTAYLRSHVTGVDPNSVNVSIANDTTAGVAFVVISAQLSYNFLGMLNLPGVTIQGRTRVPVA